HLHVRLVVRLLATRVVVAPDPVVGAATHGAGCRLWQRPPPPPIPAFASAGQVSFDLAATRRQHDDVGQEDRLRWRGRVDARYRDRGDDPDLPGPGRLRLARPRGA